MNSFIVTGASASGKSTLIEEAIKEGYTYLPTHMTRAMREGEINGTSAIFLTNDKFESNYNHGLYLEPSLDFAYLKALGVYYGTPIEWLQQLQLDNHCASPVSIYIAGEIYRRMHILWLHLYCDDYDRYNRLVARGMSTEEVKKRMSSGDSINIPSSAILMNTSEMCPEEIMEKVKRLKI